MALNNFDNLKSKIIDQSHRNDLTPDRLADFILQAEQEFYANSVEPLQIRDIEQTSNQDTVIGSGVLALPSGYQSMRSILIDDKTTDAQQYELTYLPPEVLVKDSASGTPSSFAVTNQIEFDRPCDAVYNVEVKYFGKLTGLSDAATTNDILTNFPNVYLFGALWALHQWAVMPDLAQYYYTQFINAIRGANNADVLGRHGPAPTIAYDGVVV